jgi:hypothetical protein
VFSKQCLAFYNFISLVVITCTEVLYRYIYIYILLTKHFVVNFIVTDSGSDSEDTEGVYYSVCDHRQQPRRKQQHKGSNQRGQSTMTVMLSVSQGVVSLYAPVRVCTIC